MNFNNFFFEEIQINVIQDSNNEYWFYKNQIDKLLNNRVSKQDLSDIQKTDISPDNEKLEEDPLNSCLQFINKSDLYQLLTESESNVSKKLKKWFEEEVLLSINKQKENSYNKILDELNADFKKKLIINDDKNLFGLDEPAVKKKTNKQFEKQSSSEDDNDKNLFNLDEPAAKRLKLSISECKKTNTGNAFFKKKDIVYILTNNTLVKKNIFKIGKTDINNYKKHLYSYNKDCVEKHYYVYYKHVFNGYEIKTKFNKALRAYNIKPYDKSNKDFYQLCFTDLKFYLEKIIDSNDNIIELIYINKDKMLSNAFNKPSSVVPVIIN